MRAVRPLEALLALCGCLAWQGSPIDWVATHRKHHATTDQSGDPHSPRESFWWGHMGWLIFPDRELQRAAVARQYAPELLADPMYRFFQWTYPIYQVLFGVGLYLLGGWGYVVWGIALRTVVVWHSTWLVNSATHLWGFRSRWASSARRPTSSPSVSPTSSSSACLRPTPRRSSPS